MCNVHKKLEGEIVMYCFKNILFNAILSLFLVIISPSAFAGELHNAVRSLDLESVNSLIRDGYDVNEREQESYQTPLDIILQTEKIEESPIKTYMVAKLLLEAGARLNSFSLCELTKVRKTNITNFLRLVLKYNADPNRRCDVFLSWVPVERIIGHKIETAALEGLELLVAHGAKLNVIDVDGSNSVVKSAIYNGREKILLKVIDLGATHLEYSLKTAIFSNNPKMVKILLDKGAQQPNSFVTDFPFQWACRAEKDGDERNNQISKIIDLLIQNNNLDLNSPKDKNSTPLNVCIENKKIVEYLIKSNVDVNAVNISGLSPLMTAINNNDWDIVDLLLTRKELDVDYVVPTDFYYRGETALSFALEYDNSELIEKLLSLSRVPSEMSLHLAIKTNNEKLVKTYLSKNYDVNIQDNTGNSALHLAILYMNESVARYIILNSRPNFDLKNKDNLTPMDLAISKRKFGLAELILEAKTSPTGSPTVVVSCKLINEGGARRIDFYNSTPQRFEILQNTGSTFPELRAVYQAETNEFDIENYIRLDHKSRIGFVAREYTGDRTYNEDLFLDFKYGKPYFF